MNTPEHPTHHDLFEEQLQRELRSMFDVDTQQYLQNYSSLALQLNSQSWTADIQEMYRAIHTIKGGAVTVEADAILYVATTLEDLLSDLRYLDAPPLADGKLGQMLLEAGELLTSSINIEALGEEAQVAVAPSVERLEVLREEIRQFYLPEWDEQSQLYQEFAEQGFDLVVLDLEMALEKLPEQGNLPVKTQEIARETLAQLSQIGQDLEFTSGWGELLQRGQELISSQDLEIWRSHWTVYLKDLKNCARHGGKLNFSWKESSEVTKPEESETDAFDLDPDFLSDLDEIIPALEIKTENISVASEITESEETETDAFDLDPDFLAELAEIVPVSAINSDLSEDEEIIWEIETPSPQKTETQSTVTSTVKNDEVKIQIPVPLTRLDQTAQHLVETLLSARAAQGFYKNLQSQLVKLYVLAEENVTYITRLRQIQDNYALLNELNDHGGNTGNGVMLEKYRQGYTTINRLLETSLRLSELGAEAAKNTQQTAESLQSLDRNLLDLQQTVEDTRLVPFNNLMFRARAILRDLNNRYGKQAQLVVQGEQLELDAGTTSKLEPALLHLLRNAYDHGLESPQERVTLGKPAQGTIRIALQRRGNNFYLEIQDDGRGINPQAIQQIAQEKGLPLTSTKTPGELLAVISQPGFSSQNTVSDLSGRGVGMDVVANQVATIGGKISLETALGLGTTFNLQIPVPHFLLPCILCKAGDFNLAIPMEDVITTTLFSNLQAIPAQNRIYSWNIQEGEETIPGLDFLEYWQTDISQRSLTETTICICLRSHNHQQKAWLIVDDLLGQIELLTLPIPSPLTTPVGLMGLSLQSDGALIPVLEPTSLIESLYSLISQKPADSANVQLTPSSTHQENSGLTATEKTAPMTRSILVVDDAALMRRRLQASLSAYGYVIHTCVDGQEAWTWLQTHPQPDLVITDIEMPNMDGFTLINYCRQIGMSLPILVISSRLAEEWGKEAKRLGATDYLTKGFSTPELINTVSGLMETVAV